MIKVSASDLSKVHDILVALVNLFEMATRLVRAFSQAKDTGKVRLYLSKSAEVNIVHHLFTLV